MEKKRILEKRDEEKQQINTSENITRSDVTRRKKEDTTRREGHEKRKGKN